ncbi:MAG TPA: thermonuclease family protein [Patescibacteria group bacterium]|nr:thermonuclease family protein [Patescibacteria group bacterium]
MESKKRKQIFLLICLIVIFLAVNYSFIDKNIENFLTEQKIVNVVRVIDGDTIVVENNTHIRLLGINTPEKGEFYHDEAMNFLAGLVSNKSVKLEYGKDKTDLYGRTLAYVFLGSDNINLEQVRNGFANVYILGDTKYESVLRQAWNECIISNNNLCEKSAEKCASCIELKNLDVKKQTAIFYNNCSFSCFLTDWNIKDEGRKNFYFPEFTLNRNSQVSVIVGNQTDTNSILFWKGESYVWTSAGDTLFLRDEKGKLVLWKNY